MNTTISRVEQTLTSQQARIQALEAALAPFAQAWELQRSSGGSMAQRVRGKRHLNDQHLHAAHMALKGKP